MFRYFPVIRSTLNMLETANGEDNTMMLNPLYKEFSAFHLILEPTAKPSRSFYLASLGWCKARPNKLGPIPPALTFAFSPLLDSFLKHAHTVFSQDIASFTQRGADCGFELFFNRTNQQGWHTLPPNRIAALCYRVKTFPSFVSVYSIHLPPSITLTRHGRHSRPPAAKRAV